MVPLGADQGQHRLVQQEGGSGPEDLAELPISFSNSHMDVCRGLDTKIFMDGIIDEQVNIK